MKKLLIISLAMLFIGCGRQVVRHYIYIVPVEKEVDWKAIIYPILEEWKQSLDYPFGMHYISPMIPRQYWDDGDSVWWKIPRYLYQPCDGASTLELDPKNANNGFALPDITLDSIAYYNGKPKYPLTEDWDIEYDTIASTLEFNNDYKIIDGDMLYLPDTILYKSDTGIVKRLGLHSHFPFKPLDIPVYDLDHLERIAEQSTRKADSILNINRKDK